jgi:hypothetical protein
MSVSFDDFFPWFFLGEAGQVEETVEPKPIFLELFDVGLGLGESNEDYAIDTCNCTVFLGVVVDGELVDWKIFDDNFLLGLLKTDICKWDALLARLITLTITLLLRSFSLS